MEEVSEFGEIKEEPSRDYREYRNIGRHGKSMIGTVSAYGRRWFVKSLVPPLAGCASAIQSLQKEFDILLGLNHQGIVRAIEFADIPGAGPSIIMEYLKGQPLNSAVTHKPLSCRLNLADQLVNTVEYLHSKGITHGDLKPENIIVTETSSFPKLTLIDFNLSDGDDYTIDKTAGGNRKYAAPEQFDQGYRLRPQADVYSLGLLLKEMRLGWSWRATIRKSLNQDPDKRLSNASAVKIHYKSQKKKRIMAVTAICSILIGAVIVFVSFKSKDNNGSIVRDVINVDSKPLVSPLDKSINLNLTLDSTPDRKSILIREPYIQESESSMSANAYEPIDTLDFSYFDRNRVIKELQIKQIFIKYKKEIESAAKDSTSDERRKFVKINDLYATAWNRALFTFKEFIEICPQEYAEKPPVGWQSFFSQKDFTEFNDYVVAIKDSLFH